MYVLTFDYRVLENWLLKASLVLHTRQLNEDNERKKNYNETLSGTECESSPFEVQWAVRWVREDRDPDISPGQFPRTFPPDIYPRTIPHIVVT